MLLTIVSKAINHEQEGKYIRGLLLIRLHCRVGVMAGEDGDPGGNEGEQGATERPVVARIRPHELLSLPTVLL